MMLLSESTSIIIAEVSARAESINTSPVSISVNSNPTLYKLSSTVLASEASEIIGASLTGSTVNVNVVVSVSLLSEIIMSIIAEPCQSASGII